MARLPDIGPFYEPSNPYKFTAGDTLSTSPKEEPYVTEICIGPSSASSHTTGSELEEAGLQRNLLEPDWNSFIDERGDLFYVELDHSIKPYNATDKHSNNISSGLYNSFHRNRSLESQYRTSSNSSHSNTSADPRNCRYPSLQKEKEKVIYLLASRTSPNSPAKGVKQDHGQTLCRSLFGVVLCQYKNKHASSNGVNAVPFNKPDVPKERKLIVQDVLLNSEAEKTGCITRGDMLLAINDVPVSWSNLQEVLSSISQTSRVKLTLQSPVVVGPKTTTSSEPSIHQHHNEIRLSSPLLRTVIEESLSVSCVDSSMLHRLPHVVLYLTMDTGQNTATIQDNIIYQYPSETSKLVEIRGLFLTLCNILIEVTNNSAKRSTLFWEKQVINAVYYKEGRDVLVLAMPEKSIPCSHLLRLFDDVIRILKLAYGTVGSAFRHKESHTQLDQLFCLLFCWYLQRQHSLFHLDSENYDQSFLHVIPAVRWLKLMDEEDIVNVDDVIGDMEAADFTDEDEEILEMRRTYTILGSCLYYKGYLLCNHLPSEDMLDISVYLKYHCVLHLSSEHTIKDLVIWHEVFPTRLHENSEESHVIGFTEPDARYFLLVTGINHCIYSVLLEAGGCAAWADGKPTPDPFYVDQCRGVLLHLQDIGIKEICENRLQTVPSGPSLVGADWWMAANSRSKDEPTLLISPNKLTASPKPVSKSPLRSPDNIWRSSMQVLEPRQLRFGEGDPDSQSLDVPVSTPPNVAKHHNRQISSGSGESEESANSSGIRMYKPGLMDLSGLSKSLNGLLDQDSGHPDFNRLTRGPHNVLFHYVTVDGIDGVYICPNAEETRVINGAIHSQVLSNFYQCCLSIHGHFERTNVKQLPESQNSYKFTNPASSAMLEHGVLFQFRPTTWHDPKKSPPKLNYWVVGRRFPVPDSRELYVCFHDSTNQTLLELAFRMLQGVAL